MGVGSGYTREYCIKPEMFAPGNRPTSAALDSIHTYVIIFHIFLMLWVLIRIALSNYAIMMGRISSRSNRKAMDRNWSNQKANPALKTKTGNK